MSLNSLDFRSLLCRVLLSVQGFVLICFPPGSVSLQHVNNKTGSMTWLDKHLYISRKKERSGFIIDGTILGSYLRSLIERCVFSRPWEKEKKTNKQKASDSLCQFFRKVKKQEKLGPVDLWAGTEEHWPFRPWRMFWILFSYL